MKKREIQALEKFLDDLKELPSQQPWTRDPDGFSPGWALAGGASVYRKMARMSLREGDLYGFAANLLYSGNFMATEEMRTLWVLNQRRQAKTRELGEANAMSGEDKAWRRQEWQKMVEQYMVKHRVKYRVAAPRMARLLHTSERTVRRYTHDPTKKSGK